MSGDALKVEAIGKEYPPVVYEVGREKIREYAAAVGVDDPVHHDRGAALKAGFRDVVAPPMFCVVYSAPALIPALTDPEIGIDFKALVHGGQEFSWGEPVCAGDEITTKIKLVGVMQSGGRRHYDFESVSTNQDGAEVARGTWANIVRGSMR